MRDIKINRSGIIADAYQFITSIIGASDEQKLVTLFEKYGFIYPKVIFESGIMNRNIINEVEVEDIYRALADVYYYKINDIIKHADISTDDISNFLLTLLRKYPYSIIITSNLFFRNIYLLSNFIKYSILLEYRDNIQYSIMSKVGIDNSNPIFIFFWLIGEYEGMLFAGNNIDFFNAVRDNFEKFMRKESFNGNQGKETK